MFVRSNYHCKNSFLDDSRIDPNKKNTCGRNGSAETVKILLNDNRVNINQKNNIGETSYEIGHKSNSIELIKLLLTT